MTDAVLVAIIAAPALVTYLLKSDAALSFLALCAGFVLSTSVVTDLKHLLSETNLSLTDKTLALILLLVPLVITLLTSRRSAGKGFKLYLHLLTAICVGGLLVLSLGPIINSSSQIDLAHSGVWDKLQNAQSIIIGAGALLSLFLIWFKSLKYSSKKHK